MTLADWLVRLESLHPEDIELGLERAAAVAGRMDLLSPTCKVVTIAGTNGKGTTVALLDQLLRRAGNRTGRYTSPHMLRYNERVCIDGCFATDLELVDSFVRVEAARQDIPLTYYEFGTLSALDLFSRAAVDTMLLEVGLGGRLDAVNILNPDLAIITSIALDHESWLGSTREEIALEKAGILRAGIPFVCADLDPPQSLRARATELGCKSRYVTPGEAARAGAYSALRGENIAAAELAAVSLGIECTEAELATALSEVYLPGRLQQFEVEGAQVVLDVAHNPASVQNLADYLAQNPVKGRTIAVFAALSDKNIRAMIRSCRALFDTWFIADLPGNQRAAPVSFVARELQDQGIATVIESSNPLQAYRRARDQLLPCDRLVVFGSFFTVAELLPTVEQDRSQA